MEVRVQVDLGVECAKNHIEEMHWAASSLTDNQESVHVHVPPDEPMSMIAAFMIPKAREMVVVDGIMKRFAL